MLSWQYVARQSNTISNCTLNEIEVRIYLISFEKMKGIDRLGSINLPFFFSGTKVPSEPTTTI